MEKVMTTKVVVKKIIKEDESTPSMQVLLSVNKENSITFAIAQNSEPTIIEMSYNQLCSLSRMIDKAINNHYQAYSNSMEKEKTSKIYIDDPIDW
jgi:hypothetical protein